MSSIEYSAFSGCTSLKEVALPSKVLTLNRGLFSGCSSLEKVSLYSNYFYNTSSSSSDAIFAGCSSLKNLICYSVTPPTFYNSTYLVFGEYDPSFKIKVPAASVDAYKAATFWSGYADIIEAIE